MTTAQGQALVRRPGPRLADGIVTHVDPSPIDLARANQQWQHYVDVMADSGWDIVEVPPADDCPDAVFVEDTVLMHRDLAIICRSGAAERRAEIEGTAATLSALGYRLETIAQPATLDGGDVLKVPADHGGAPTDTIYVGRSGRTNDAGIDQLRTILDSRGARVVAVPTTSVLHLKSAVTALPDGTVIGYRPLVDAPQCFDRFIEVPEEPGAHVVLLGDKRLLMSAGAPETADLLSERGYEPVLVDIDEFEKLEGCVTCLSVRLRHTP